MSRIDDWKKAKKIREQSERWLEMRNQIATYDHACFVPRMDVNAKMYMCGQYSQGGQNYFEPPKEMVEAFTSLVSKGWLHFAQMALVELEDKERTALLEAKSELQEALSEMGEI